MSDAEPSWELYRALLAVLREGSLSGGARALGVVQPTVRRQIEELEELLGAALFARSSNGLVPTEVARAALPYAEALSSTANALKRAVSGGGDPAKGTVRITASEIVGIEVLPAMIADMRRANPGLHIELVASNRNDDILRRDADIAVRMIEPTQIGLSRRRIGAVEIGFFAHERYLAEHPAPRSMDALLKDHALIGPDSKRAREQVAALLGPGSSAASFVFRSESDVAQLAAVRAGVGVGVCQVPLSRAPVPLVRVLPTFRVDLETWLVMHEDLRSNRRVRVVFDDLAARLERYVAGGNSKKRHQR